jgi:hypothetical protein
MDGEGPWWRTSHATDAELVGDIDVAVGACDSRVLDLLDHVLVALPWASAHGASDGLSGTLTLGGCPHLETFLVHILAAGGTAVHGVFGTLKWCETDGAIPLYLFPVSILDLSIGGDLNRRSVLKNLTKFG